MEVVELEDEGRIAAALADDRGWAAYALCDLEPANRRYARYVGAIQDGRVLAVVLAYSPPGFTSIVPCGDPAGVAAILRHAQGLPLAATVLVQPAARAAVEARYRFERAWRMLRMLLVPGDLRPVSAPGVASELVPLDVAELPELQRLYAANPESVFTPAMLVPGVYFGARVGGELVAVAGTHGVSARHRIAVIGNVFTHPAHRGAGLATAVTAAVAAALIEGGATEVALNVREGNNAAVRAYERAGFAAREWFWEGDVRLLQKHR